MVQSAANLTTLTTTTFTPADNELIVVKVTTADTSCAPGTASGGGLTYATKATIGSAGSQCQARLITASVGVSPGSMSVSVTVTGTNQWHSMVVERWSNAQLATTPAIVQTTQGSGTAPSGTVTTVAANSMVSWAIADWSAQAPTSRAYRSSATEEGIHDGSTTQYVAYFAYQSAPTAGAQTVGMTAPTQQPSIVGIEIQDAGGSAGTGATSSSDVPFPQSVPPGWTGPGAILPVPWLGTGTNPGIIPQQGAVSLAATSTLAADGTAQLQGAVALNATPTLTAPATLEEFTSVSLNATAGLSLGVVETEFAAVSLAATPTLTSDGARTLLGAVSLSATPTLTAQSVVVTPGAVSLVATATLSGFAQLPGGSATLTAAPTLSVNALLPTGSVSLNVVSTLSAAALPTGFANVALSATGQLSLTPLRTTAGAVVLSIGPNLTAQVGGAFGAASLSVVGVLSAAAWLAESAAISLTISSSLALTSGRTTFASSSLNASAALSVLAYLSEVASVSLSAIPVLSAANPVGILRGVVGLAALGILSANVGAAGNAALVASGLLNTNGITSRNGSLQLSSTYVLSVNGVLGTFGATQLSILPGLIVSGTVSKVGAVILAETVVLSSAGLTLKIGAVVLAATGQLLYIEMFPEIILAQEFGGWTSGGIVDTTRLSRGFVGDSGWTTGGIHSVEEHRGFLGLQ